MINVNPLTIKDAILGLEKGSFRSQDLVESYLLRINKYNKQLHAFITVREEALEEAKLADQERKKGLTRPLLGIPIGVKDNFLTKGVRTTSASRLLDKYIPTYDSTVVARLKRAGAIIIGKTNLDAWGHGSSGEHTDYGFTKNPYDLKRVTGGSSSGSGAAVAASLCLMGTGSDTGGSNRQPGSYCNVVGFKPTYGRVSRYGVISMASSTDSMGTLTKTVWDTAYCLSIIAGHDSFDQTSSTLPVESYHQALTTKWNGKVGIIKEFFEGLDPELATATMNAIRVIERQGNKIVEISLPNVKYAYPMYCLSTFSEISSNLARFDGVRYGNDRGFFADEPRRRMMIGTHSLSTGYRGKFYDKAMKARAILTKDFIQAFEKVDIIAGPVFPFPPFKHGEREIDPLKMYLSDVLTVPASITGQPALSVPIEFVKKLPNGLQLIAPHFGESTLFKVAKIVEEEYQMYKKLPNLK